MSNSYHWLFHPDTGVALYPDQIVEDINRVLLSLELLLAAEGYLIDENVRKDWRLKKKEEGDMMENGWGGKRQKRTQNEYLHQLSKRDMHIYSDTMAILQKKDDIIGHTILHDELPSNDGIGIWKKKV